jgi:hypothetical protein
MNSPDRLDSRRRIPIHGIHQDHPARFSRLLLRLTTALMGVALCFLVRNAFDLWVATLGLCAAVALIIVWPEPIPEV